VTRRRETSGIMRDPLAPEGYLRMRKFSFPGIELARGAVAAIDRGGDGAGRQAVADADQRADAGIEQQGLGEIYSDPIFSALAVAPLGLGEFLNQGFNPALGLDQLVEAVAAELLLGAGAALQQAGEPGRGLRSGRKYRPARAIVVA